MKKRLDVFIPLLLLSAGLLLFSGCGSLFPTSYDRVDSDRTRLLDFIYEPEEAAPGDTVTIKAIFAGKKIPIQNISWRVAFNVVVSQYGATKAFNPVALHYTPVAYTFSDRTFTIGIKYKIPEDIMIQSAQIPEDISPYLGSINTSLIPVNIKNKKDFVEFLSGFSFQAMNWKEYLKTNSEQQLEAQDTIYRLYKKSIRALIPSVVQFTTVKYRIYADLKDDHTIFSDHSVRFNKRFYGLPKTNVFINRNPVIDSVYIYRVPGENIAYCDTSRSEYRYKRLRGPQDSLMNKDSTGDTVVIEGGYSYFLRTYSSAKDSALTFKSALSDAGDSARLENHNTEWYFALDSAEANGASPYDFISIFNNGTPVVALYPSKDHRIHLCTMWLEVNDSYLGELLRPQGSTLKEFHAIFDYR